MCPLHCSNNIATGLFKGLYHLFEARLFSRYHVIWQNHGEGLVCDQSQGAPHRMAQSERLMLPHIGNFAAVHIGLL